MSILKIKSKDIEVELNLDDKTASNLQTTQPTCSVSPEMVALLTALALNEVGNATDHDEESGRITIKASASEWSAKSFGLNKGISLR
ncbi:MAG: hypothetical protein IJ244_02455 [Bacteroidaceae bacterium]|nr:hypothetical protein [Bacteroidaceae bacterium]